MEVVGDSSHDDSSHIPTTSISSPTHKSSDHASPTFSLSTLSSLAVSQTSTSTLPTQAINFHTNPFYSSHFSRPLPRSGPPVFPRSSPNSFNFGVPPPVTDSITSESETSSYSSIPSRIVPTAKPKLFIFDELQPRPSFGSSRRHGRVGGSFLQLCKRFFCHFLPFSLVCLQSVIIIFWGNDCEWVWEFFVRVLRSTGVIQMW